MLNNYLLAKAAHSLTPCSYCTTHGLFFSGLIHVFFRFAGWIWFHVSSVFSATQLVEMALRDMNAIPSFWRFGSSHSLFSSSQYILWSCYFCAGFYPTICMPFVKKCTHIYAIGFQPSQPWPRCGNPKTFLFTHQFFFRPPAATCRHLLQRLRGKPPVGRPQLLAFSRSWVWARP